jgi:methylated-DNA-protein-cysteine methyltransferase-like protein
MKIKISQVYLAIYAVVNEIPKGTVATYGQVAALSQCAGPRQVGYALHRVPPDFKIPWHRVVNSKGMLSLPNESGGLKRQKALLESEGVAFNDVGKLSLKLFQWNNFC